MSQVSRLEVFDIPTTAQPFQSAIDTMLDYIQDGKTHYISTCTVATLIQAVATEAIAARLTLICSKYAGFSSHVTHGIHGYIVDPTHHEELTDYVVRLLQSPDLRDTMNRNAQSILYQFKPPYVAQQFIKAIEDVLKSSS